jgi:alpha-L-arabinofuranosidase
MRFPGGCITEGVGQGNQYNWKQTVGPLVDREEKFNLWAESRDNGDYSQSFQLGFYEYFLLCEDLGMEPVPVVWAGLSCQYRSNECVASDSDEFKQVVQDAVDLIDWATGDPKTSEWARLRAEAGHPEPFKLRYVGIGNENHGADYLDHFEKIQAALDKAKPRMKYILAAGAMPKGKAFDQSWDYARGKENVILDEHSYAPGSWFIEQQSRYDSYPRTGATVMVGEWAAYAIASIGGILKTSKVNLWESAVAEAAFMTGLERNADLVEMACYAPLFANIDAKQWRHNLIEFDGFGVHPTANYQVQKLFASEVGKESMNITGDLPNHVFASATGDKSSLLLKLVNTGAKVSKVSTSLPSSFGKAQVTKLTASPKASHQIISVGKNKLAAEERVFNAGVSNGVLELDLPPYSVTVCRIS